MARKEKTTNTVTMEKKVTKASKEKKEVKNEIVPELIEDTQDEQAIDFDLVTMPEGTPGRMDVKEIVNDHTKLASLNYVRWGSQELMKADLASAEYAVLSNAVKEDKAVHESIGVYKPKGEKKYVPVYGFGRLCAAIQHAVKNVPVNVFDANLTQEQIFTLQLQENSLAGQKRTLPWGKIVRTIDRIVGGPNRRISEMQWQHLSKRFGYAVKTLKEQRRRYHAMPRPFRHYAENGQFGYNLSLAMIRTGNDKKAEAAYTDTQAKEILEKALYKEDKDGNIQQVAVLSSADIARGLKAVSKTRNAKSQTAQTGTRASVTDLRNIVGEYIRFSLPTGKKLLDLKEANRVDLNVDDSPSLCIASGILIAIGDVMLPESIGELKDAKENANRLVTVRYMVEYALRIIDANGYQSLNKSATALVPYIDGYVFQTNKEGNQQSMKTIDYVYSLAEKLVDKDATLNGVKCKTHLARAIFIAHHAAQQDHESQELVAAIEAQQQEALTADDE